MTMVASGNTISVAGTATTNGANQSVEYELKSTYGTSGANTISLNDSAVRTLAGVASGAISLSNFYGKSNFTPVTRTYTTVGSGTETIPTGASQVVITVWGAGGGGGRSGTNICTNNNGGGGGSGAYVKKTLSISSSNWGQTLSYLVATRGAAGITSAPNGGAGGTSTVSNGTFTTSVSLSAGGGGGGASGNSTGNQGSGGTASGGDTNTNGNGGGGTVSTGAAAPNGGAAQTNYATNGNPPGGGGSGGQVGSSQNGGQGADGQVVFAYT
jgi:hypothetical protein